jgi:hypothetical protein
LLWYVEFCCFAEQQGAPIAGYILDAQSGGSSMIKSFRPAMFYAGSLALASAVLTAAMRLKITTSMKKRV